MSKLAMALLIGAAMFAVAYLRGSLKVTTTELKSGWWFIPYLMGLIFISYLGSFGGKNLIPFGWDFLIIAIFSLVILYLAVYSRTLLSSEQIATFLKTESVALEH